MGNSNMPIGLHKDCFVRVDQPDEVIWRDGGQFATIPCDIFANCSPGGQHLGQHALETLWFVFTEHSHRQVDLQGQPHKYSLQKDGRSLKVHSLQTNDSGVYHCAMTLKGAVHPWAQEIGRQGTTLVVEDKAAAWYILSWFLFALLVLYSLALLVLIIRKKTGQDVAICRRPRKTKKNSATKRAQFRAVVQELYNRRGTHNPNHHGPSQPKVESPQSNMPAEDIYQNV